MLEFKMPEDDGNKTGRVLTLKIPEEKPIRKPELGLSGIPLNRVFDVSKYESMAAIRSWTCKDLKHCKPENVFHIDYNVSIEAYDDDGKVATITGLSFAVVDTRNPSKKVPTLILYFDFSHIEELYNYYVNTLLGIKLIIADKKGRTNVLQIPSGNADQLTESVQGFLKHLLDNATYVNNYSSSSRKICSVYLGGDPA